MSNGRVTPKFCLLDVVEKGRKLKLRFGAKPGWRRDDKGPEEPGEVWLVAVFGEDGKRFPLSALDLEWGTIEAKYLERATEEFLRMLRGGE